MLCVLDVGVGDATSSDLALGGHRLFDAGERPHRVAICRVDRVCISPSSHSIIRGPLGPGRERGYDVCVCCYALHHMPRVAGFLSELRQSLLPVDGRLLLMESLPRETTEPLISCAVFGAQSMALGLPFQMHHRRSRAEWRAMLGESGFQVVEEREIAPSPVVPYVRVAFLARPAPI